MGRGDRQFRIVPCTALPVRGVGAGFVSGASLRRRLGEREQRVLECR
jgi:hypothetical protein